MDLHKIETLLAKYYDGETMLEEEDILIAYFNQEESKIAVKLRQYRPQFQFFAKAKDDQELDDKFDKHLEKMVSIKEKLTASNERIALHKPAEAGDKLRNTKIVQIRRSSLYWIGGIAASFVMVVASFFLGRISVDTPPVANIKGDSIRQEIQALKKALVGLQKPLASDRLKAVKATSQTINESQGRDQVLDALINTLNNDENQNVRLAAANALFVYKDNPKVKNALIVSISHQTDPVLKIAMINMLLAMKDKRAVAPIERILKSDREIPKEVKETIQDNLKAL